VFDVVRIAQAVSNLIGNAVQHGEAGEMSVPAEGMEKDWLEVSVRNAGRIPEPVLGRLFEPFKGSFHPSKGLGLGLYIADQFVRAHGGTLRAENLSSEVCFRLRLPRVGVAAQG
jgi:signal transduction histidine kinase